MARRKKPTAYDKEVQRVKRQLKSLSKRGYLTEEIKIPKTLKAIRKLSLESIYSKIKYIDQETGELISGKRGREMERSKRSKKSAQTRKRKMQFGEPSYGSNQYETDREKEEKKREEREQKQRSDKATQQEDKEYYPKEEDIILDNLVMLINKLESADTSISYNRQGKPYPKNASVAQVAEDCRQHLLDILNNEIRSYNNGTNIVARRVNENIDRISELVDTMLYYNQAEKVKSAYSELVSIITGGHMSDADRQYFEEVDESLDGDYGE